MCSLSLAPIHLSSTNPLDRITKGPCRRSQPTHGAPHPSTTMAGDVRNIHGPKRAAFTTSIAAHGPTRAVEIHRATKKHDDERNGAWCPGRSNAARGGHSSGH